MLDAENGDEPFARGPMLAPLSYENVLSYAMTYDADPFSSGGIRLTVEHIVTGEPVGFVDLYEIDGLHTRAFIGIYICRKWRERGFGSEAVEKICSYARFTLGIHQVVAEIEDGNVGSIALFERLGFICAGVLRDWVAKSGGREFADVRVFQKIF